VRFVPFRDDGSFRIISTLLLFRLRTRERIAGSNRPRAARPIRGVFPTTCGDPARAGDVWLFPC